MSDERCVYRSPMRAFVVFASGFAMTWLAVALLFLIMWTTQGVPSPMDSPVLDLVSVLYVVGLLASWVGVIRWHRVAARNTRVWHGLGGVGRNTPWLWSLPILSPFIAGLVGVIPTIFMPASASQWWFVSMPGVTTLVMAMTFVPVAWVMGRLWRASSPRREKVPWTKHLAWSTPILAAALSVLLHWSLVTGRIGSNGSVASVASLAAALRLPPLLVLFLGPCVALSHFAYRLVRRQEETQDWLQRRPPRAVAGEGHKGHPLPL